MFDNLGTAIVQALGFFGVFGFFVYRLLSEKDSTNSLKENTKNNSSKPAKSISSGNKLFFSRKKKVEPIETVKKKENKKGWFKR